jgi:hypothetical protein
MDCGTVRSHVRAPGRPLGYFHQALANVKAILDTDRRYAKLAQVHTRLISRALESIPDFGDPYSMPFETQWRLFIAAVRKCRPDLDEDFLAQALPRDTRHSKPAFIELRQSENQEEQEP